MKQRQPETTGNHDNGGDDDKEGSDRVLLSQQSLCARYSIAPEKFEQVRLAIISWVIRGDSFGEGKGDRSEFFISQLGVLGHSSDISKSRLLMTKVRKRVPKPALSYILYHTYISFPFVQYSSAGSHPR